MALIEPGEPSDGLSVNSSGATVTNGESLVSSREDTARSASKTSTNFTLEDSYGSGVNSGEALTIGFSGFTNESELDRSTRKRRAVRAPLNVGTFGILMILYA